eukprot:TRINITY_DN2586_c1_g1_i1.p1 TRINITY_DN2586_c1_g1~~TRINITY_DN2586_c1_g1_i1.p1  ORF type:complete len:881 (+),score=258.96 TRINITY_DN2586_c1_g1_i1:122-2764(+)
MAEAVVVGVRVRPFNEREKGLNALLCVSMNGPTTNIRNLADPDQVEGHNFSFDESFWSHDCFEMDENGYASPVEGSPNKYADQRYVYDVFGQRVLDNAWAGFHCCLFAYGQTGAGKSYSMVGYGVNKGIVPVSCEEIFKRIAENTNPDKKYEVEVSIVEIYNEAVQDLLVLPEDRPKKGLEIRESKLLGIYIDGVTKTAVASYEHIEATIKEATDNRTVGATLMNATSSRAHTVVTIGFKQLEMMSGKMSEKLSMINLVDLAGSEKAGQTGATGDRLKEGAAINKSLTALGNVIEKLAARSGGKKNIIVPYRDSKLTRLLQNALGGSSKTIMICALSPASSNYEETLSTLRYADRAKKIKNTAQVNENPQDKLLRELREENSQLKAMLEEMKSSGQVNIQKVNELQEDIAKGEEALREWQKPFEERLKESEAKREERQVRKSIRPGGGPAAATNASGREFAEGSHYLANLNEDMQLTGRIKHELAANDAVLIGQVGGKVVKNFSTQRSRMASRISVGGKQIIQLQLPTVDEVDSEEGSGSSDSDDTSEDLDAMPDVLLRGEGIASHHATITNKNGKCYLMAKGAIVLDGQKSGCLKPPDQEDGPRHVVLHGAEKTFISGVCFLEALRKHEEAGSENEGGVAGVLLQHGDRVVFGHNTIFVYVDPSQFSNAMGEFSLLNGKITYSLAAAELEKAKWKTKAGPGKKVLGSKLAHRGKAGRSCFSDTDMGDEQHSYALLSELRAQLAEKDKEIADLNDEVAELRASGGTGASALTGAAAKAVPSVTVMAPQLAKAKELAASLKAGFNQTVGDLDNAKQALDSVQQALKAIQSIQGKKKKAERKQPAEPTTQSAAAAAAASSKAPPTGPPPEAKSEAPAEEYEF